MEKILHIETATEICSVALSDGDEVIEIRETEFGKSHAGVLTVFINEILDKSGVNASMLDAVAVSMGPGSYTGLRIGVSVAKGLCYGTNIPLIAIPTLEAMYYGMKNYLKKNPNVNSYPDIFIPMIDARRLEVYMAVYDKSDHQLDDIKAFVVNPASFNNYLHEKKVCFFGNGAPKIADIIKHKNAFFFDEFRHSSRNMINLALDRFKDKKFEDVAYFEPFYLKEFLTTVPKKNLITQI